MWPGAQGHFTFDSFARVLNRSGYVSPETQRRVEEAATELGYHPNWLAHGIKGKPSHLIGLIIPDISNTYYTAIAPP